MCGFLGQILPPLQRIDAQVDKLRASANRLVHRGNSSHGEWQNSHAAFFHHRLAFRDLNFGQQPMLNHKDSALLVYNGELYDFRQLRKKSNYPYRTDSDTEVILGEIFSRGSDAIADFDGEFAFAYYDIAEKSLLLARDPFGVKPLFFQIPQLNSIQAEALREFAPAYRGSFKGSLAFASEIKALPDTLRWDQRGLQRQVLGLYEEMGTAWENVFALAPGSFARFTWHNDHWQYAIERYTLPARKNSRGYGSQKNFSQAAKNLREIIGANVSAKLDSDVPLGVYLSSGIDSRAVAIEMARHKTDLPSFTLGFAGKDYDETEAVKKFLRSFPRFRPHFLHTTDEALAYSYPIALYHSELIQPYTNGSAKWWLSRFARKYVRGVLTGDGADEIFCGYPSYRYLAWWQFANRAADPASPRWHAFAKKFSEAAALPWENGWSAPLDGRDLAQAEKDFGWAHPLSAQIQGMGKALLGNDFAEWLNREGPRSAGFAAQSGAANSPLAQWQNYFLRTHFPTHVLNWVGDRMEMANTLEGRPLYLSRSIQDFLAELPDIALVRGFTDKAVLRKAYAHDLQEFAYTPKKQFNAPFLFSEKWEKEFLNKEMLEKVGLLDRHDWDRIQKNIQEPQSPLEKSFYLMLRQNILVAHMLQRFMVEQSPPERSMAWEEEFMTAHTEIL